MVSDLREIDNYEKSFQVLFTRDRFFIGFLINEQITT